jgi:hypothetical protein
MTDLNATAIWDEAARLVKCQEDMRALLSLTDELRGELTTLADQRDLARDIAASFESDIEGLHIKLGQYEALETYWTEGA